MMQNGSCECSKSELNVLSVASLANNAPIEFITPPQTEH